MPKEFVIDVENASTERSFGGECPSFRTGDDAAGGSKHQKVKRKLFEVAFE